MEGMFFKKENLKTLRIDDNTFRTVLSHGEGLMTARVYFEKGMALEAKVPFHCHAQTQTTFILKGAFKFAIKYPGGVSTQIVNVGDSIYFPSNYEHGCIPLEDDSQLLDSFTPIREDFLEFEKARKE
ncbi:MAG: cupin domain-containing protein [Streptococcaceae bacterium]|jgi:quercetin dioxygenase-like cupin family protein|nr:cupin domain-containing protein [Streptococcaceae bacterium]